DGSRRDEAADLMKIKAEDQLEMGIIEGVVQEEHLMENLKAIIEKELNNLAQLSEDELQESRYQRFRKY
ncbi:acetyl-CoA carboxylase carboxyl transferase subunit alpha, partial [Lawsonibacter sp. DFI.5.51]|nr:acetyl-CoA carboxylase carboxyl transferase subunit alpha [Lawsonibacter sp. DFI.5.51]